MNNSTLKDEAAAQMEHLKSEPNRDIAQMLMEMACHDEHDARHLYPPMVHTKRLLKNDVLPCEQSEPEDVIVLYEPEQTHWAKKALWFVVGVLFIVLLAILAG